jgi:hypothetical protein
MPRGGTIKSLRVESRTNTDNADVIFTVRKAGADSALVLTYPSATSSGVVEQNTDVTFAENDLVVIKVTSPGHTSGTLFITSCVLDVEWS